MHDLRETLPESAEQSKRGGMLGDVEMYQAAPTVRQHHQYEKNPKGRRGHGEEVDGNEIANVVIQV